MCTCREVTCRSIMVELAGSVSVTDLSATLSSYLRVNLSFSVRAPFYNMIWYVFCVLCLSHPCGPGGISAGLVTTWVRIKRFVGNQMACFDCLFFVWFGGGSLCVHLDRHFTTRLGLVCPQPPSFTSGYVQVVWHIPAAYSCKIPGHRRWPGVLTLICGLGFTPSSVCKSTIFPTRILTLPRESSTMWPRAPESAFHILVNTTRQSDFWSELTETSRGSHFWFSVQKSEIREWLAFMSL